MERDRKPAVKDPQTIWAAVMFYLSLLYLLLVAVLTVVWIDVPRVAETIGEGTEESVGSFSPMSVKELRFEQQAFDIGLWCGAALLVLWPIFIAEQVVRLLRTRSWSEYRAINPYGGLICLIPPLRMCERERGDEERLWLPWGGWHPVDRELQSDLERRFSIPMIWIALLILPVLGLEVFLQRWIIEYPWLRMGLHIGTGLIWFAFTFEFIVMISVAERKLRYCKKNWLDLIIILLPLVSFLRTLRIIRATKLMRVGKLQKLTKLVRVYRLRGVLMRTLRALMLLEVLHRILPYSPEKKLKKLNDDYADKVHELLELREEMAQLRCDIERIKREEAEQQESQPPDEEPSHESPVVPPPETAPKSTAS